MAKQISFRRERKYERGQIAVLLALSLTVLLLFAGLAIDIGFAYVTKAKLSKAVDAACMTGMKNLASSPLTFKTLATNSFNANYQMSGLDANLPSFSVNSSTNTKGQTLVDVSATATINTFFLRLVPGFKTLSVSESAQSTRGKLVMTMVLDRSGSMGNNGGGTALKSAGPVFVGYFSDSSDEIAMTSFASNATLNLAMNYNFTTPINNAITALTFTGATFGLGGLTLAKTQEDNYTVQPGQNVVKVVVYFTDGLVNTIQQSLSCDGTLTLYNFGGYDSGSSVGFFNPTTGVQIYSYDGSSTWYTCDANGCSTRTTTSCLRNVAGFTSAIDGHTKSFTRTNVTADAKYQSLQIATAMRTEGIYVYALGLGTNIDQAFLQQIANDPASSTYSSTQPQGLAGFAASCPSSQCTMELQQIFQTIAAKILLRLSQ
jgi:Flp pilus assembly protein TadG